MKLFIIAMLACAATYAQETQIPIEYKTKAYKYDTTVQVARFGEKNFKDKPDYFLINRDEKYVKLLYPNSKVEYRIDTVINIDMWYAGSHLVHFVCTRPGVKEKCNIYWVYYERANNDSFFEFVIEEPDSIEKFGVKTN
jgi:hypothetical protein